MRQNVATAVDVTLTVLLFCCFVPLLLLASLILAGKWALDAARELARAALQGRT